ncbi:MAG: hypothetical protein JNL73_21955 [Anaerolineales bacterium]|nr:hypothetical protein [Anaerolineales bacterium]
MSTSYSTPLLSRLMRSSVIALCATGLAACGQLAGATPTVEPAASLATICDPMFVGQSRVVEGFFIYPDVLTDTDPLTLILSTGPGGIEPYVHVPLAVGQGANQVEPPPIDATDQDLRVRTAAGEVADMSQLVRVRGVVTEGDMGDGSTCYLADAQITLGTIVNPAP